jgi:hypothetical protein
MWGTGTATANAGMAGDYLDLSIRQNYVTAPGLWSFSEILSGTCDANAAGNPATVGLQGQVNGNNLAALGALGDCAGTPFTYSAVPAGLVTVGSVTQMIAGVQYFFPAGGGAAFPESITLPFGDDFPNPSITFNDPNNPFNFVTNTDIPISLTQQSNAPEPDTLALTGLGALALAAAGLRGSRRRAKGNF